MNALQEEITQKTLALCVEASKMTAQLLQQAIKKVLADMEKHKKNPQLRHGKQTLRQLVQQRFKLHTLRRLALHSFAMKNLIHGDMIPGHQL